MNYQKLAQSIVKNIGGSGNIQQVTNCATRLRFVLKDNTLVNEGVLKKTQGVMGTTKSGGQFQIIIGTEVPKVKKEVENILGADFKETKSTAKDGFVNKILGVLSGSITPMIPALTGAGLMKAFMALFVTLGFISKTDDLYIILNFIADSAFYFMPIIVAYGAAKKFNCNSVLAMVVAGVLIHPNFVQLVTDGTPITFMGMNIQLVKYGSTIISAILSTWVMSYIENISEKFIPKFLKYFFKPLVVIAITSIISILFLAPLGNIIGNVVATAITSLNAFGTWIIPTVIGGIFPLLIMTGMHWSLAPIWLESIAVTGSEILLGPGSLASNIAQGAASLCVSMKTKDKELKQIASSAGFTALMGITEPAMFGVTVKYKGVLASVMCGGLVGGFFAGITGVVRYAAGGAGIALLPCFIGENPMNVVYAILTMVISFVVTFACTWFFGFKKTDDNTQDTIKNTKNAEAVSERVISAPLEGKVIPLTEVPDETFAQKIMGDGAAIIPSVGKVYSPVNGEIIMIFDTLHAIAIKSEEGLEILIHVGLDTVKLNGKYFKSNIKQGDKVNKGQLLLEFDNEKIKELGYNTVTPIIITNTNDYSKITVTKNNSLKIEDSLMSLNR